MEHSVHDSARIHPSAVVDPPVSIGPDARIWHFCHIMPHAHIGARTSLGQNCFVAAGVRIGAGVKVQNNVSLYAGTEVEDDVFLGPSCVLTNVRNPRAQIDRKGMYARTRIRRGATVGANATLVCGIDIGRYAFIGAGAVVVGNVPDYRLMLGVPAAPAGWVSRHGRRLSFAADQTSTCPESGLRYRLDAGSLRCVDVDEDEALPAALSVGRPVDEARDRGEG